MRCVRVLSVLVAIALMVGCGKAKKVYFTYTYDVDTGDSIRILIDTDGGYSITYGSPFSVLCGDDVMVQGVFITEERFEQYCSAVRTSGTAELIEASTVDGNECIFWCFSECEYLYAVLVGDSKTGVLIGGAASEEVARDCFGRLVFEVSQD